MAISYKKLWKILIDRDMKKGDLARAADLSGYTLNKLNHGENAMQRRWLKYASR